MSRGTAGAAAGGPGALCQHPCSSDRNFACAVSSTTNLRHDASQQQLVAVAVATTWQFLAGRATGSAQTNSHSMAVRGPRGGRGRSHGRGRGRGRGNMMTVSLQLTLSLFKYAFLTRDSGSGKSIHPVLRFTTTSGMSAKKTFP